MSPDNENSREFLSKRIFETLELRQQAAEAFINSLGNKPKLWRLSGSSANQTFRPDSDLDVTALYEHEADIPLEEIFSRSDPENDLIDGYIDFHFFAEDWEAYQHNPTLLERFKKSFEKS